jgi:hypothetical protein
MHEVLRYLSCAQSNGAMVGSSPASQSSYSTKPQLGIEVVAGVQIKKNSHPRMSLPFVGKRQEPLSDNSTVFERKMASPTDGSAELNITPSLTFLAASTADGSSPTCFYCDKYDERDATKGLKQPCHGWPQLATVIADNAGFESFQTFRDLNIKSLLYYQAELVQLRKELHNLEWEDYRQDGNFSDLCSRNILFTEEDPIQAQDQLNKVKRIREVLKDYSKTLSHITRPEVHPLIFVTDAALLQYSKINELPKAEAFNVKSFPTWIAAHIRGTKPRPQSAPLDPRDSYAQREVCHLSLDVALHVGSVACSFQWQGY